MFYQFDYLWSRAWRKRNMRNFLFLGSCNFLVLRGEAFLQTLLPEKVVWWSNPLRKYCFCLQNKSRELVFHPSSSLSSIRSLRAVQRPSCIYLQNRKWGELADVEELHQNHLQGFSFYRMNLFNLFILLYSYMEGKLNLCNFTTIFFEIFWHWRQGKHYSPKRLSK